jgi:PhoH-like ATPase
VDFDKVFVLDTNIILNDASNIFAISENGKNLIVLPETVIDELDNKKSGFDEINFQARQFGRFLNEARVLGIKKAGQNKDVSIVTVQVKNTYIDIISFINYDLNGVEKSILNDRKIIKVAQFASNYYKNENCKLISDDTMCRTRAISLNVDTMPTYKPKEDKDIQYIKTLNIDSSLFNTLQMKDITEIDPEWRIENYCYRFMSDDGNECIGYIANRQINIIEDDLRAGVVKPLNLGQRFSMAGMMDQRFSIVLIEALAGSGKTLLALSTAVKLVQQGKYDKIIYIRNSVESVDKAEQVGFLSGNEEKFRIYNMPLYDTLEFIAQKTLKNQKNEQNQDSVNSKVDELIKKYNIETMWIGEARGRTLSNAFVIVDEVQNFAKKSLQTILTRVDKDCKVVCIGSNRQIDHPFINKYTNGLSILLKVAKEENPEVQMFATELTKVVRGPITEFAERIFEGK